MTAGAQHWFQVFSQWKKTRKVHVSLYVFMEKLPFQSLNYQGKASFSMIHLIILMWQINLIWCSAFEYVSAQIVQLTFCGASYPQPQLSWKGSFDILQLSCSNNLGLHSACVSEERSDLSTAILAELLKSKFKSTLFSKTILTPPPFFLKHIWNFIRFGTAT